MKEVFLSLLRQFGTTVTLRKPGSTSLTCKAFFQPVTAKGAQAMQKNILPGGTLEPGQYLYIGNAELLPEEGDTLVCAGKRYRLRRCDCVYFRDTALFYWALCTPDGRDIAWT